MDDCRASHSRHDTGPGDGQATRTHTRSRAEQAIEVAHPHAQPGASLLDQEGNALLSTMPDHDLARLLRRHPSSVESKRHALGVRYRRPRYRWWGTTISNCWAGDRTRRSPGFFHAPSGACA
jgi:hypothetical protein